MGTLCLLARPERLELPTAWFVVNNPFLDKPLKNKRLR